MRHSGNTGSVIDQTFGGEGATMKVYVHDEMGRFVTVANLSLGTREIEALLDGIQRRRDELEQGTLFGLEEGEDANKVRWLPPRP